jgi:hypothetical protein
MNTLVMLTLWLAPAALPAAPLQGAVVERALDEPAEFEFQDVPLSAVFDEVLRQCGVRVVMAPEAYALTPHGSETRVTATFPRKPLRAILTDLVAPLGMDYAVTEDGVEVIPRPVLACLGRAATWEELDLITELASLHPGTEAADRDRLRERVQFQLPVHGAWTTLEGALRNVGAGTAEEALTIATRNLGWSWCVSGNQVIVRSVEGQYRERLRQPVELRMSNRPLYDVLQAIGNRIGVPVRADPGALQSLPPQVQRNFSVNVRRQTAEQTLDTIAAYTGLGYLIDPEGVLFYAPSGGAAPRSPDGAFGAAPGGQAMDTSSSVGSRSSDPYVAKLVAYSEDGRSLEWLIRASELPEDLLDRRARDIQDMIEALRGQTPKSNP